MVSFLGAGGWRGGSGGRGGFGGRGGTTGAGGLLCLAPPVDVLPCGFGGRGGTASVRIRAHRDLHHFPQYLYQVVHDQIVHEATESQVDFDQGVVDGRSPP